MANKVVRSTARERKAQAAIMDYMIEQGYGTFARLFSVYTFILTKDPGCIGYTTPDGIICLNEGLSMDGFSFVCRHEILHQWLDHHERFIKHVGKKLGLDPNKMSVDDINKACKIIYGDPNRSDNIAKDWELSKYYTDADKRLAKHLDCCGQICEGLVLELDKPEWMDLSAEELYEKLLEHPEESPMAPPPDQQNSEGDGQDDGDQDGEGSGGGSGQGGDEDEQQGSQSGGGGQGDEEGESDPRNPGSSGGRQQQQQNGQSGQRGEGNEGSEGEGDDQGQEQSQKSSGRDSKDNNGNQQGHSQHGGQGDEQQSGGDGKGSDQMGRPVMIGDRGNKDIQEEEQRKREQQVQKDIEKGRLEDKSEEELQKEQDEKIKKLDKEFSSEASKDAAEMDIAAKKRAENDRKAKLQKRIQGGYNMQDYGTFKSKIAQFCRNLKNEADQRNRSWARMDRKNQNPQIMRQGKKNVPSGNVPIINVYLDCSGSCTPYHKAIMNVAKMLTDLQNKDHLCVCNIYYFANTLGTTPNGVGWSNSWGGADLAQHLIDTGAQNAIICTDGDTNGLPIAANKVRLEHAWFICVQGIQPKGMINSVLCRRAPEVFKIDEKDA